jgi:hypothetical protein
MGLTSGKPEDLLSSRFPLTQSTRFFDDIELLRQRWQSANTETVAELYVHRSPSPWRYHSIIFVQAHRFFQVLLSRVFLRSGGGIYPRRSTEEGKQGLVN